MNRRVVGALLLLLLGVVGITAVWYFMPWFQDLQKKTATDAQHIKGKITVALDNWIGYFIFRSPEMRKELRRAGWSLVCEDDGANYAQRMKRLRDNDIEFAVATVDSLVVNTASFGVPGIVIMVIDESKGGDAILARKEKVASLDQLRNRANITVAFTPDSPSHYLLKAAAHHFNLPELLPAAGPLRIETQGSSEALTRLLAGKADVAVLWEPDVSRALAQSGITKILGTEDTQKLIVDILLVNKKLALKNPEVIKVFLSAYFSVLKEYRDKPALLREHLKSETGLPEDSVESMVKGVRWVNLAENCEKWFGISGPDTSGEDGLVSALESTVKTLINAGDFSSSPIPDNDAYRLINSTFLQDLFVKGVSGFTTARTGSSLPDIQGQTDTRFAALNESAWDRLKEVGTLKVEPVMFQQGASHLDSIAKETIDRAADLLGHYPNFRVIIKGHTATTGDPDENKRLSQDRAEAVAKYLVVTHRMDQNRLRATGFGGTRPFPRRPEESLRAWEYRLPRVEISLVREEY
ncbi:MAG: OmpA family protein [Desulfomonile tiedjei]|uniref:OmpA family protein n=1 Tax=Desulfomonile tiedjei TaxID=2358 RepID=A0A9D6V130_9BACT|nr:OmpA family protein [Desulfomonile tiedjei]